MEDIGMNAHMETIQDLEGLHCAQRIRKSIDFNTHRGYQFKADVDIQNSTLIRFNYAKHRGFMRRSAETHNQDLPQRK